MLPAVVLCSSGGGRQAPVGVGGDIGMERPAESFATAERLICMLRDVSSCEIQLGTDGAISAVHVTALPGRSPKQIARDVEAILAAEEGVHLDHRKISIAQVLCKWL